MAYHTTILGEGNLLRYWTCGDAASTTTMAASFGGVNGTYNDSTVPGATGLIDGTAMLAQASGVGAYVNAALTGKSKITFECLVKWTTNANNDKLLAEYGSSWFASSGRFIIDWNCSSPANKLSAGMSGAGLLRSSECDRPTDGAWHHLVVEFDYPNNSVKIWVDNVLQTVGHGNADDVSAVTFANESLSIGGRNLAVSPSLVADASIQHVAIYDGSLSDARRAAHYAEAFATGLPAADWSSTPSTSPIGSPGDDGYLALPAARFDTVPRQTFTATTRVGVQAWHKNGISKVSIGVHGTWTDVTTPSLNPDTGVWGFHVAVDPTAFTASGMAELRAIAYPSTAGTPRLIADGQAGGESLFLAVDKTGTDLPARTLYWKPSSVSDGNGLTSGTPSKLWATILATIVADQANYDGCTVKCLDGNTDYLVPATTAGDATSLTRVVTLTPDTGISGVRLVSQLYLDHGAIAGDVSNANWSGTTGAIKHGLKHVRFLADVSIDFDKVVSMADMGGVQWYDAGSQILSSSGAATDRTRFTYFSGGRTWSWTASTKTLTSTGAFTGKTLGSSCRVYSGTGVTPTPSTTAAGIVSSTNDSVTLDTSISAIDIASITDLVMGTGSGTLSASPLSTDLGGSVYATGAAAHDLPQGFSNAKLCRDVLHDGMIGEVWTNIAANFNSRATDCDNTRASGWVIPPHGDVFHQFGASENRIAFNVDSTGSTGFFDIRHDQSGGDAACKSIAYVNCKIPNGGAGTYADINSSNEHVLFLHCTMPDTLLLLNTLNGIRPFFGRDCLVYKSVVKEVSSPWVADDLPQFIAYTLTNGSGGSKTYHFSAAVGGNTYNSDNAHPPANVQGLDLSTYTGNPTFTVNPSAVSTNARTIVPYAGLTLADGASAEIRFTLPEVTASGTLVLAVFDGTTTTNHTLTVTRSTKVTDCTLSVSNASATAPKGSTMVGVDINNTIRSGTGVIGAVETVAPTGGAFANRLSLSLGIGL